MRRCALLHFACLAAAGIDAGQFNISGGFRLAASVWDAEQQGTVCGARADLQTAGLNGVFAHFCRCWQKWVAPVRETPPSPAPKGAERCGRGSSGAKQQCARPLTGTGAPRIISVTGRCCQRFSPVNVSFLSQETVTWQSGGFCFSQ